MQLIRGLNRKFQVMATLLPMQVSFPSLIQARSRLLMEEITTTERARLDGRPERTSTALTVVQGFHFGSTARSSDRGAAAHTDKGKGPSSPQHQ